jgi:hypothetical protein
MMTTLVSLVGEQTIPNILFILEMQRLGQDIGHYLFVTTSKMEELEKTDCIIKAAGLNPLQCERVVVVEDAIDDIVQRLGRSSQANHYLVNLTGGTKMMSVACYTWFSSHRSRIFYVPIGKNGWIQLFPSGSKVFTPFATVLTLKQYWDACNITGPADSDPPALYRSPEFTASFFKRFVELRLPPKTWQLIRDATSLTHPTVETIQTVRQYLDQLDFKSSDPKGFTKSDVPYLTGKWFEEYVYSISTTWLGVAPAQTSRSVRLIRGTSNNEYDCLALVDNTLHVMECKTSLGNGADVMADASYKLAALRSEFGIQAKSHLLTADPALDESPADFRSSWARARILGVRVAGPSILLDRSKTLREFDIAEQ